MSDTASVASEGQSQSPAQSEAQESQQQGAQESQGQSQPEMSDKTKAQAKKMLADGDMDAVVKVKIDGQEHELTVRELSKLTSLEKVSQKKMQEAAHLTKQVQQFINWAKQNPGAFLKETGIDPEEWAASTLKEKYELMQMTPEQRELLELRQLKAYHEQQEQEKKQREEQESLTKVEQETMQSLEQEFIGAWQETGLPKNKIFGQLMAAKMLSASRQGKNLQAKEAAHTVKQEFIRDASDVFAQMDPEQIQQILGAETMKKLRKFDVERVTGKASIKSTPKNGPVNKTASTRPSKTMGEREYKEFVRNLASSARD